jgi:hypothetical protein
MNLAQCQRCGCQVANHGLIHFTFETGSLELCTQCYNADVAERFGADNFDNHAIDPVAIVDGSGLSRTFHFQARLMGPQMLVLEAFELENGARAGMRHQIVAKPDEDRFTQLGRLIQKIRRALAVRYLEDTELGLQIKDMEVRGQIDWDSSDEGRLMGERSPMLMIDGREVRWEDFGRMLMTFEGFHFKLQIADPADELG